MRITKSCENSGELSKEAFQQVTAVLDSTIAALCDIKGHSGDSVAVLFSTTIDAIRYISRADLHADDFNEGFLHMAY